MMNELLAGVTGSAKLGAAEIERLAARMLAPLGLAPGCDARHVAFSIGLGVRSHERPTGVRNGIICYDRSLAPRDRDVAICRALARTVLSSGRLATDANVVALTLALTRRASGVFVRTLGV